VSTDVFRDLEEAMDHFFTALYQRMFTVVNAQFRFDEKYLAPILK
jgi:glypican 4